MGFRGRPVADHQPQLVSHGSTFFSLRKHRRNADNRQICTEMEQCVGRLICRSGRNSIWEACGPARDAFDEMAPQIKGYLDSCAEPISGWVTWSMYMIGSDKASAIPTVLFCCDVASHRREVRDIIKQSGILRGYPGVKTGDMPQTPGFEQLVTLAAESIPGQLSFSLSVNTSERCLTIGNSFDSSIDGLNTVTLGGVIRIRDKFLLTTAGHPFRKAAEVPILCTGSDHRRMESEEALSLDEDSDAEGADSSNWTSRATGAKSYIDSRVPSLPGSGRKEKAFWKSRQRPLSTGGESFTVQSFAKPLAHLKMRDSFSMGQMGGLFLTGMACSAADLDYALIELDGHDCAALITFNDPRTPGRYVSVEALAENTVISTSALTITSRGTLPGTVSETPSYARGPQDLKFRRMIRAFADGRLEKGDCGSWVIDADTGNLHGHVIAGSPGSGAMLVLPFSDVFDDISHRVEISPELPVIGEEADNNAKRIPGFPGMWPIMINILLIFGGHFL
ncbi:hypothetical protein PG997_014730 [Apiospora hydei]|uniref:Uncharacterized protein n=1 Tax=Apiospora hydei TaxID=1337664 RepID=A0ABR1UUP4_9PEZI